MKSMSKAQIALEEKLRDKFAQKIKQKLDSHVNVDIMTDIAEVKVSTRTEKDGSIVASSVAVIIPVSSRIFDDELNIIKAEMPKYDTCSVVSRNDSVWIEFDLIGHEPVLFKPNDKIKVEFT